MYHIYKYLGSYLKKIIDNLLKIVSKILVLQCLYKQKTRSRENEIEELKDVKVLRIKLKI